MRPIKRRVLLFMNAAALLLSLVSHAGCGSRGFNANVVPEGADWHCWQASGITSDCSRSESQCESDRRSMIAFAKERGKDVHFEECQQQEFAVCRTYRNRTSGRFVASCYHDFSDCEESRDTFTKGDSAVDYTDISSCKRIGASEAPSSEETSSDERRSGDADVSSARETFCSGMKPAVRTLMRCAVGTWSADAAFEARTAATAMDETADLLRGTTWNAGIAPLHSFAGSLRECGRSIERRDGSSASIANQAQDDFSRVANGLPKFCSGYDAR